MMQSRDELLRAVRLGRAKFVFMGPSGQGKSWWAHRLANNCPTMPFTRYDCDSEIALLLHDELKLGGHVGIAGVSDWMGQPYDERYERNQRLYIEAERAVMRKLVTRLETGLVGNIVSDATGSAIYADPNVLERLCSQAFVIYLAASEEDMVRKRAQYFADPKPIAFMEYWDWDPDSGEDRRSAVERCYDAMVRGRAQRYPALADVTLGWADVPADASPEEFLEVALRLCPAC